jgi:hypothetical protein
MYRSPLLGDPRRRGLPGGASAGNGPYYGQPPSGAAAAATSAVYARPPRAARLVSLLLLFAITFGALAAQKVLICDVDAEDAAIREAALLSSLKRLQGTLATRSATGGASFTAYQARACACACACVCVGREGGGKRRAIPATCVRVCMRRRGVWRARGPCGAGAARCARRARQAALTRRQLPLGRRSARNHVAHATCATLVTLLWLMFSGRRLSCAVCARAQGAAGAGADLSAPEKVRYDRKVRDKEISAQRAKKDAAAARAESAACAAQLRALAAAGDGDDAGKSTAAAAAAAAAAVAAAGADSAAAAAAASAAAAGRAEAKALRAKLKAQEGLTRAAEGAARAAREQLAEALADVARLQARLSESSDVTNDANDANEANEAAGAGHHHLLGAKSRGAHAPAAAPAEGGVDAPLDPDGSTEEGVAEGEAAPPRRSEGAARARATVAVGGANAHGRMVHGRARTLPPARGGVVGGGAGVAREASGSDEPDGARDRRAAVSDDSSYDSEGAEEEEAAARLSREWENDGSKRRRLRQEGHA